MPRSDWPGLPRRLAIGARGRPSGRFGEVAALAQVAVPPGMAAAGPWGAGRPGGAGRPCPREPGVQAQPCAAVRSAGAGSDKSPAPAWLPASSCTGTFAAEEQRQSTPAPTAGVSYH